jgi:hypothetical protein
MLGNRISHFKNCHQRIAVSMNTSRTILVLLYTDQTNRIHTSKHRTRQKNMHNFQAAAPPRFTNNPCKTS